MNHSNFNRRLDFIKTLLRDTFGLHADKIEPIEYDPDCKFPYNNFIYKVRVSLHGSTPAKASQPQPGTEPLPVQLEEVIIRLSNNEAMGVNNTNRVENEVASMQLARQALSDLIPAIYGWSSAKNKQEQGWVLMKFMPGVPLDGVFPEMSISDKARILEQMAKIVFSFQQLKLPETITGLGGLTFDTEGAIVNGEMTILPAGSSGPFSDLEDFYRGFLLSQLEDADQSSVINGWRSNNVRARLNNLIFSGLREVMGDSLSNYRKTLVHADLTTNNLLFDPRTLQITALIDFDFSHIGSLSDEFCRSFGNMNCTISGPFNDDPEQLALRNAFLKEFPNPLPKSESIDWELASKWDDALKQVGARRPASLPGIDAVSGIYGLADQLCPFRLSNSIVIKRFDKEKLESMRKEAEEGLEKVLQMSGF